MPHPSSSFKRSSKSSSPKTPLSWWEISLQLLKAVGIHGQLDPCPSEDADVFGHIPHLFTLVDWPLTILTQPESLTCTTELSCGDLSREGRWMEGPTPFSLFSYYRAQKSASKGTEKLRVKPVEILEKPHHWCYCWLFNCTWNPCNTFSMNNFLNAAFQIVVCLVLLPLRHCSSYC